MYCSLKKYLGVLEVSPHTSAYQNADILPLPSSRRTWSKKTFIFFWLATAINIAEWSGASTALAVGLTVGQAIAVNAVSTLIICMALVGSGHAGGSWHIPFAIINRTGWGVRGAWFPLLNRIILSCCWYGVQGWYGGQMVKVMIGAIWPSFYTMKSTFGPNTFMQTNEFISFFIFWTVSLPIFLLRPEQYRLPAVLSSIIVTIAAFSIFIWAILKQGNIGPLWNNPEAQYGVEKLSGFTLSWVMMRMVNSGIGGWAGGILYQSDFSRYAIHPGDQIWGQIFVIPICLLGSNILGIITTSCARGFYPDEPLLWKLYDLLEAIQMHEGKGARAAVFFAAFAFFLSQVCVNVVACGVVGGMDLAALLPRFIDIRRGSFVIAIIGICINPWRILNTANSFISAISGYAVFLGPLSGIMLVEYYAVRRRRIKLSHLYIPNRTSDYWYVRAIHTKELPLDPASRYWNGLNMRAPVAWAMGVWPSMPGFINSINPAFSVNMTWIHVYYMSWLLGFSISGCIWLGLNIIWPCPGLREVDNDDISGLFGFVQPLGRNESSLVVLEEKEM